MKYFIFSAFCFIFMINTKLALPTPPIDTVCTEVHNVFFALVTLVHILVKAHRVLLWRSQVRFLDHHIFQLTIHQLQQKITN